MKRTGLKKWVMQKSARIASDIRSVRRERGSVEVLEETMEPGRRTRSSASYRSRFTSMRSTIASAIQSQSPTRSRWSSTLPAVMRAA